MWKPERYMKSFKLASGNWPLVTGNLSLASGSYILEIWIDKISFRLWSISAGTEARPTDNQLQATE